MHSSDFQQPGSIQNNEKDFEFAGGTTEPQNTQDDLEPQFSTLEGICNHVDTIELRNSNQEHLSYARSDTKKNIVKNDKVQVQIKSEPRKIAEYRLFGMVKNSYIDVSRKHNRQKFLFDKAYREAHDNKEFLHAQLNRRAKSNVERKADLGFMLAQFEKEGITRDQLNVFVLREVYSKKFKEIGEILGFSTSKAYKIFTRVRAQIDEIIITFYNEPPIKNKELPDGEK